MSKNKSKTNLVGVILSVAIILVVLMLLVFKLSNDNKISFVRKVFNAKYDEVKCINSNCDGIYTREEGNKNNNIIRIYNSKGNLVIKYVEKKTKSTRNPYDLKKEYFLEKKTNSKGEITKYIMKNKSGKEIYSSSDKLSAVSDYFAVKESQGRIGDVYTLISKNGKELYSNITEFEKYNAGKYIYLKIDKDEFLLNEDGKKILEGYIVEEEVKNEDTSLYLVVREDKSNSYYYFNCITDKIEGDGFTTYKVQSDNTLKVTRKENNTLETYNVSTKGVQKKSKDSLSTTDTIKEIKEKVDENKYYIYTSSIVKSNQRDILVDDLENKKLGLLNIDTNNFNEIYSYKSNKFYSTINEIESLNEDVYLQISCNQNSCDKSQMIVYNFTKNKEVFKLKGNEKFAQNYIQFENGYKVFKYAYTTEEEKYKGKYVLYDNKNKELFISDNEIKLIDSNVIVGKTEDKSLILYNSKENKKLNDDQNLAEKLNIKRNDYYKYNSGKKTIIIDSEGNNIYSVKTGNIEYNEDNIFVMSAKEIKIYNIESKTTSKYKLEENETYADMINEAIKPYKETIFINNTKDNYVKIINSKGKILKTIKNASIKSVGTNEDAKKAYIIVKRMEKAKMKFGLYIAK